MTKEQFDFYRENLLKGDSVELTVLISNGFVPMRIIVERIQEKDGEIYIVDSDNTAYPVSKIIRIGR